MKLIDRLNQRVSKLNRAIDDYMAILVREEVQHRQEVIEYVQSKIGSLQEKRMEYLKCIKALRYLENHLDEKEIEEILKIEEFIMARDKDIDSL
ncbi:hypothetical protein [Thermotalea metallivorans]|uniref:Uncharacterized protein n=1 Tax=Thermotalea metallivorans TaxID=520762 RepID=A0A140L963_9FIRM|nr:hypothetical protein [Thermotalea metallivorans]KXG77088.1 hypothetical protein AN619_06160 [Thermotalea metallivorans]